MDGNWDRKHMPYVIRDVDPTTSDVNHPIPTTWINSTTDIVFTLTDITAGSATWQVTGVTDPMIFQGAISVASDFPTSALVQNGWFYRVLATVTDNDVSKTNTGQSFVDGDEIVWNGTDWTLVGSPATSTTFTGLLDTPGSYASKALQLVRVAAGETTLEFIAVVPMAQGGLNADVSGFAGLVKIAAGSASAVTVTAAGEAILDDADNTAQRVTLGLGSIATQSAGSVTITGGTIDTTAIGGTTPAAGAFTTLKASSDPSDADGVGDRGYNDIRYAGASHAHAAGDITSGVLAHEQGGLELDVSLFAGLVKITGGTTSAVTVTAAGEAILDDANATAQRATLGLGDSATKNVGSGVGDVAAGDDVRFHAAVSVGGAPLTLSTQQVIFNFNTDDFDLDTNDLRVTPATTSVAGKLEIATNAEAIAVTETDKALVPSNVGPLMAAPPAIGGTAPNNATFLTLGLKDATALTISAGSITKTQSFHRVDGEGSASDELDTIAGGAPGQKIILYPVDVTHDITIKHGTGNILTPDGNDYTIPDNGMVELVQDSGNKWRFTNLNISGAPGANEPQGFPNRTDSSISFDDGTRTLTVDKTGTGFSFYVEGVIYTKTSAQTKQITDTEGLWYFYFDNTGELNATQTFNDNLITSNCWVMSIYWDATGNTAIHEADERHGIVMDGATHLYLHHSVGAAWDSGAALGDFTIGDGNTNSHAQISVSTGDFHDEDIEVEFSDGSPQTLAAPAQLPVYYLDGAGADWRKTAANTYPVKPSGGTRLAYNEFTGGAWQQTEVTDNKWVLSHIFATNEITEPIIVIQGQEEYSSLSNARDGATTEINTLVTGTLPVLEFVPLGTVIFQTKSTYSNAVKAKVVQTDTGDDYIDWRGSKLSGGGTTVNDHGNLSGLGDDDHPQYVLEASTDASGYGFFIDEDNMVSDDATKFPSQQSVKKYVDDNVGGGGGSALGLAGVNEEALSAGKTLTANTDVINQRLDTQNTNRIITLSNTDAVNGNIFKIKNISTYTDLGFLDIKNHDAVQLQYVYAGGQAEYVFNGTDWQPVDVFSGGYTTDEQNNASVGYRADAANKGVAVGYKANGADGVAVGYNASAESGVAVGWGSNGGTGGVGVGRNANGSTAGTAVGENSSAAVNGVALGQVASGGIFGAALGYSTSTNSKSFSVALGIQADASRTSEVNYNITGEAANDFMRGSVGYAEKRNNATPVEMFLGDASTQRLTVPSGGSMVFYGEIVARDNVAGHTARWTVSGTIENSAGTTTLKENAVVEVLDESGDWAVSLAADNTNDSLKITITGDPTNPTWFAGQLHIVEVRF